MNYLFPHQPTWLERLIEKKLESAASNPAKNKAIRKAAKILLRAKRTLDSIICW